MRLNASKIAFNDLLNRNKLLSKFITSLPLVVLYIIRRINKIFYYTSDNIMIVSLHKLGDSIFAIPAVKLIQEHFNCKIFICCYPEAVPIYSLAFNNINYCVIEKKEFYFSGRIANRNARKKIKNLKSNLVIDFTGNMTSASLIFNLRAQKIIGSNGQFFKSIYDEYVTFRQTPQLTDIYLDAIECIIKISNRNDLIKQKRSINPDRRIMIQPFAGWKEKEWPFKNYVELVEKINYNFPVSFIFQNGQVAHDIIEDLENSDLDVIQTDSVEELIKYIKDCSILIGNDSGPVNIANFLGKPTLTIYGATNPDYTATYTDHQIYIQKTLNCSAKKNEKYCMVGVGTYNCPGIQCMNFLSVYDVYERLAPLLNKYCRKVSKK
jgi:ADP-heptose:LPS heptosyltransferase